MCFYLCFHFETVKTWVTFLCLPVIYPVLSVFFPHSVSWELCVHLAKPVLSCSQRNTRSGAISGASLQSPDKVGSATEEEEWPWLFWRKAHKRSSKVNYIRGITIFNIRWQLWHFVFTLNVLLDSESIKHLHPHYGTIRLYSIYISLWCFS